MKITNYKGGGTPSPKRIPNYNDQNYKPFSRNGVQVIIMGRKLVGEKKERNGANGKHFYEAWYDV